MSTDLWENLYYDVINPFLQGNSNVCLCLFLVSFLNVQFQIVYSALISVARWEISSIVPETYNDLMNLRNFYF